jgi:hypothetical protein
MKEKQGLTRRRAEAKNYPNLKTVFVHKVRFILALALQQVAQTQDERRLRDVRAAEVCQTTEGMEVTIRADRAEDFLALPGSRGTEKDTATPPGS